MITTVSGAAGGGSGGGRGGARLPVRLDLEGGSDLLAGWLEAYFAVEVNYLHTQLQEELGIQRDRPRDQLRPSPHRSFGVRIDF